jgi:hypothetical protein
MGIFSSDFRFFDIFNIYSSSAFGKHQKFGIIFHEISVENQQKIQKFENL